MKRLGFGLAAALGVMDSAALGADGELLGFDAAGSTAQRAGEATLDAQIDTEEMSRWLRQLSAEPHHVGSPAGKRNAEFIAGLLRGWGYEVEIAEYEVL